jgi:hypothetical protein
VALADCEALCRMREPNARWATYEGTAATRARVGRLVCRRGAIGRLRLVRGLRRCRRSDQLTRPYDGRGLGAARQQTVVPDPVEPVWQDVPWK